MLDADCEHRVENVKDSPPELVAFIRAMEDTPGWGEMATVSGCSSFTIGVDWELRKRLANAHEVVPRSQGPSKIGGTLDPFDPGGAHSGRALVGTLGSAKPRLGACGSQDGLVDLRGSSRGWSGVGLGGTVGKLRSSRDSAPGH